MDATATAQAPAEGRRNSETTGALDPCALLMERWLLCVRQSQDPGDLMSRAGLKLARVRCYLLYGADCYREHVKERGFSTGDRV